MRLGFCRDQDRTVKQWATTFDGIVDAHVVFTLWLSDPMLQGKCIVSQMGEIQLLRLG